MSDMQVRSREFEGSQLGALQSTDGAHSSMWGPHSEGMEEGAVWAVEATGVETVRQALVCLHGRVDTISD